jgi:hypothetical protein
MPLDIRFVLTGMPLLRILQIRWRCLGGGGVIGLPEFFPIRVPRRVRAGLGLVFLCVVPIHQGMVPRSDSIFAILCTLPANHIILHRVNEGDLCYQFSLHREEGLVDKVLVSLIALGIHKVTNLV